MAVQCYPRSLVLVPIESIYAVFFYVQMSMLGRLLYTLQRCDNKFSDVVYDLTALIVPVDMLV